MTPSDFASWRSSLNLSQEAAAKSLGLSLRTVQRYEKEGDGGLPIPLAIEKACQRDTIIAFIHNL